MEEVAVAERGLNISSPAFLLSDINVSVSTYLQSI